MTKKTIFTWILSYGIILQYYHSLASGFSDTGDSGGKGVKGKQHPSSPSESLSKILPTKLEPFQWVDPPKPQITPHSVESFSFDDVRSSAKLQPIPTHQRITHPLPVPLARKNLIKTNKEEDEQKEEQQEEEEDDDEEEDTEENNTSDLIKRRGRGRSSYSRSIKDLLATSANNLPVVTYKASATDQYRDYKGYDGDGGYGNDIHGSGGPPPPSKNYADGAPSSSYSSSGGYNSDPYPPSRGPRYGYRSGGGRDREPEYTNSQYNDDYNNDQNYDSGPPPSSSSGNDGYDSYDNNGGGGGGPTHDDDYRGPPPKAHYREREPPHRPQSRPSRYQSRPHSRPRSKYPLFSTGSSWIDLSEWDNPSDRSWLAAILGSGYKRGYQGNSLLSSSAAPLSSLPPSIFDVDMFNQLSHTLSSPMVRSPGYGWNPMMGVGVRPMASSFKPMPASRPPIRPSASGYSYRSLYGGLGPRYPVFNRYSASLRGRAPYNYPSGSRVYPISFTPISYGKGGVPRPAGPPGPPPPPPPSSAGMPGVKPARFPSPVFYPPYAAGPPPYPSASVMRPYPFMSYSIPPIPLRPYFRKGDLSYAESKKKSNTSVNQDGSGEEEAMASESSLSFDIPELEEKPKRGKTLGDVIKSLTGVKLNKKSDTRKEEKKMMARYSSHYSSPGLKHLFPPTVQKVEQVPRIQARSLEMSKGGDSWTPVIKKSS